MVSVAFERSDEEAPPESSAVEQDGPAAAEPAFALAPDEPTLEIPIEERVDDDLPGLSDVGSLTVVPLMDLPLAEVLSLPSRRSPPAPSLVPPTPTPVASPPTPRAAMPVGERGRVLAPPRPLPTSRAPSYPYEARANGWEGVAIFRVTVRADGTVIAVTLESSSGHSVLDRAAEDAVRSWSFTAPLSDGVPTDMTLRVPVAFRLT